MTDDDPDENTPTERGRRTVQERARSEPARWDDDRRAAIGREYRGGESTRHQRLMTDSESRRRSARSQLADHVERELGGPGEIEPEITKPWAMLDREQLKPDELEIVRRSKRDSNDPVFFGDLAKLAALQFRQLIDDRSTRKEQANAILELIKHPPNEAVTDLQEEVKRIWRAFAEVGEQLGVPHSENKWTVQENIERGRTAYRWGVKLAGLALTLAMGSAGYVVASIRASGADEVLRAQERHDIEDLKSENKDLRRVIERLKDKTP